MKTQTANRNRWTIDIASDFRVIGYNPENADMDNPQGAIVREMFYLMATNERGDRRASGDFYTEAEALAAIALAPPVVLWDDTAPEYGSAAWVAYGEDAEIAAEGRMAEDEAWGFDTRYARY